ncbi:hypothetical protein D6D17_07171 [Aureobasidium pullulans]|uniref:Histone chaperone domain-containing protein n=1 Tax=Aureobasidium pullulans TaxID=5580 RepID=A0A4T0CI37_AURPU|nr:hypothetical protein D6D17_07171 [Aureobasidium pullulans]THX32286.1 hypothetical protein D6D12_02223 [Aureobasidium pullulans]THX43169.1 hypothetical protein D6D11_08132 [Aureobasidium pullulans]THY66032.1 hypothetical protein D6C97_02021 [Aureobasidium pullulans]THZ20257.1 hypothetical protein D6C91_04815 [Aureobasidium pullulans]
MSAEYTPETSTGVAGDNEYASRTGQNQIPVQKDEASIEDPIDADTADSDKVLEQDEKAAMNEDNIIDGGRTRGAKPTGSYQEPGDDEGLPGPDDGTSAIAQ